MKAEQVWRLIQSEEVGGDDGRKEVTRAMARIWQAACADPLEADSLEKASLVGGAWAVLDNDEFENLTPIGLVVMKKALIQSGYEELAKQLD